MYLGWTKHLSDPADKERFELQVVSSKPVLDRVKKIIEEQVEDTDTSELSIKQFETPNWPYLQAYKNGFKSALMTIHRLIDLDTQKVKYDRRTSE